METKMTQPVWHIRPAVLADLDKIVRLEQICFKVPWQPESLRREIVGTANAQVKVAVTTAAELIGYAAYWRMFDEGEITHIAVAPDWRRQGVGQALLRSLLEQSRRDRLQVMRLEVRAGNRAAQNLYTDAGFTPCGRRRGYYADSGEDAIIMQKFIALSAK